MEDSAYDVSYFSLTLLSQKQELTYEQQTELDYPAGINRARDEREFRLGQSWTARARCFSPTSRTTGPPLSQLTNGDYRHQSFGLKDTVLGTDGSTTTTTTRYRIQYGLRDKLPYKDAYSKASSGFSTANGG